MGDIPDMKASPGDTCYPGSRDQRRLRRRRGKRVSLLLLCLAAASATQAQQLQHPPTPRVVDLKASDGTLLKAYNLADAYLKDGQKDLARQYAEKALAMIDSHKAPLSSWSDIEQRRGEIRSGVQDVLKKLATPAPATSE